MTAPGTTLVGSCLSFTACRRSPGPRTVAKCGRLSGPQGSKNMRLHRVIALTVVSMALANPSSDIPVTSNLTDYDGQPIPDR